MQLVPISVDQLVGNMLGTYHVEQLLGQGNMSAVFLARQQGSSQKVMLTAFILPDTFPMQAREYFKIRFAQEAASLTRLQHPHILPVNDFGDQYGYPYFVTPLVTSGSVAKLLRQRGRLTPEEALDIVKQVAAALDYAHSCGVVHGSLKPVNLILDAQQKVQIAGFGLANMLKMQGIVEISLPYAHLLNIGGTFLGTAEYVAPEVVRGAPVDTRADIYALGITLFELLSGHPPFTGEVPLEVARMHVLQTMPSLQQLCPDLPMGLDIVVQRALERKPQERIASAEKLVSTFEKVIRVAKMGGSNSNVVQNATGASTIDRDATMPPTVNWFEEEVLFASGQMRAVSPNPVSDDSSKQRSLTASAQQAAVGLRAPTSPLWQYAPEAAAQAEKLAGERGIDPFEWWSTSIMARVNGSRAETGTLGTTGKSQSVSRQAVDKGRRRSIVLIASGGVVAAGLLGIGAVSLAHMLQHSTPTQTANTQSAGNTVAQQPTTQGTTAQSAPTQAAATPTAQPPTPTAQPVATTQPTPTTAPATPTPGHTGTVIGSTAMAMGSARTFNGGALIRLANGNFVAYNTACTHEGALVVYDPGTKQLHCTRHDAAFDPANNAQVLYGPPPAPLSKITIMVNGDGTITM